jgi:oligosaccharide repeat unit polymerase
MKYLPGNAASRHRMFPDAVQRSKSAGIIAAEFMRTAVTQSLTSGTSPARAFIVIVTLACTLTVALLSLCHLTLAEAVPTAILFALTGQRFIELAVSRGQDLFEIINVVAAYFFLYFACRAVYVLATPGVPRLGFFYYDDYLPTALWCASLGYLAFSAGYYSSVAKHLLARLPRLRLSWPRTIPAFRICLLLAIGFGAWLYLFRQGAFVVGAVAEETGRRFHSDPVPGIAVLLGSLLDFGWVAICVSALRRKRSNNALTIWPLLALALSMIVVRIFYTGSKQFLLEPLAQAMICYHYLKRRLRLRHAVLVGIPSVLLTFGVLNVYRFVIIGESGGAPKSFEDVLTRVSYAWSYFASDRTDGLQQSALESLMQRQFGVDALALVIKYTPERRPFGYGQAYLTIPEQAFVPRQIWHDKPIYIPTDDFERDYLGMPPGGYTSMHVISDVYQNFHLPGIVVGLFLIGVGARVLYLSCAVLGKEGIRTLAYAILMPQLVHLLEGEPVVSSIIFIRSGLLLWLTVRLLGSRMATARG